MGCQAFSRRWYHFSRAALLRCVFSPTLSGLLRIAHAGFPRYLPRNHAATLIVTVPIGIADSAPRQSRRHACMQQAYQIIIAEDDAALAFSLTRLILRHYPNAVVQTFDNGQDALDIYD